MEEFNTSLVREKIVFTDEELDDKGNPKKKPVTIRSNRLSLRLGKAPAEEQVVIRAQNMHSTLRYAARIMDSYYSDGPFLTRSIPFDWEAEWKTSMSHYEREYNTEMWAALFLNGKSVFRTVSSPFVDVIEKAALSTIDNYHATKEVTEHTLRQLGHAVRIEHSANISTTFSDTGKSTLCSIVNRKGDKDTIFNFIGTGKDQRKRVVRSIGIAAAYLELFNLRFTIRDLEEKIQTGKAAQLSPTGYKLEAAIVRQAAVNDEIASQRDFFTQA